MLLNVFFDKKIFLKIILVFRVILIKLYISLINKSMNKCNNKKGTVHKHLKGGILYINIYCILRKKVHVHSGVQLMKRLYFAILIFNFIYKNYYKLKQMF